ncbi:response regulator [Synergistales bacterium]|nr:response regulator [Synergistales bacterium]
MEDTRKLIMMVDDDPANLKAGKSALSDTYAVLTCSSAAKMLDLFDKYKPELILLDIDMPEMDGFGAIKILKARSDTRDIPVIFLTGKNDPASELEGLLLGAVDYILKPFSPPLLKKRIELHLLVESQKRTLQNYTDNLLGMVTAKTKTVIKLQNKILKTVSRLVESRDDATGGHIERTEHCLKILVTAILERNLYEDFTDGWDIDLLLQSSQLHDVGKISIKDNILLKPGRLTDDEFGEMKNHVTLGVNIIERIEDDDEESAFLTSAKIFAGTHHEKWDGSGYPNGLKEEEIPLLGRLMAIADVYDALVSERPYKRPLTHKEAVDILVKGKGTHFDPSLIDLFVEVSDQFEAH